MEPKQASFGASMLHQAPKTCAVGASQPTRGGIMEDKLVQRIKADPDYHRLVARRSSYGWILSVIMLIVYYGYILLIAFRRDLLATRIGSGVMTWGIPIGLFVIVFTVLITGIYVRRANGEFDALTARIRQKALQ
jgi:uncharacterized membrane protein (DUF485 family)